MPAGCQRSCARLLRWDWVVDAGYEGLGLGRDDNDARVTAVDVEHTSPRVPAGCQRSCARLLRWDWVVDAGYGGISLGRDDNDARVVAVDVEHTSPRVPAGCQRSSARSFLLDWVVDAGYGELGLGRDDAGYGGISLGRDDNDARVVAVDVEHTSPRVPAGCQRSCARSFLLDWVVDAGYGELGLGRDDAGYGGISLGRDDNDARVTAVDVEHTSPRVPAGCQRSCARLLRWDWVVSAGYEGISLGRDDAGYGGISLGRDDNDARVVAVDIEHTSPRVPAGMPALLCAFISLGLGGGCSGRCGRR